MRIVLLVPNLHGPSELAMNHLLLRKDLDIVGIVRSDITVWRSSYWKYLWHGLRKAGPFYGLLIGLTAYWHIFGFMISALLFWRRRKRWRRMDELIEKHQLKIYDTEDINSEASQKVLKSWDIDVMVTLYFDQILKKSVIDIPKVAALNMHPGRLPNYKGLWPEFWTLYHGEKKSGITIHHLNEKIDAGDIVAMSEFDVKEKESKVDLGLRGAHYGSRLLIKVLKKIQQGRSLPALKLKGKARYFSLPAKRHFEQYYARGGRLMSWSSLW